MEERRGEEEWRRGGEEERRRRRRGRRRRRRRDKTRREDEIKTGTQTDTKLKQPHEMLQHRTKWYAYGTIQYEMARLRVSARREAGSRLGLGNVEPTTVHYSRSGWGFHVYKPHLVIREYKSVT